MDTLPIDEETGLATLTIAQWLADAWRHGEVVAESDDLLVESAAAHGHDRFGLSRADASSSGEAPV